MTLPGSTVNDRSLTAATEPNFLVMLLNSMTAPVGIRFPSIVDTTLRAAGAGAREAGRGAGERMRAAGFGLRCAARVENRDAG